MKNKEITIAALAGLVVGWVGYTTLSDIGPIASADTWVATNVDPLLHSATA